MQKQDIFTIDKVFVMSGGRTGTTFLAQYLGKIIPDTFSIHEPDIFKSEASIIYRLKDSAEKIITFGFYHLVLGRLLGITGTRNLSYRFLSGDNSKEISINRLIKTRKKIFQDNIKLYIEANAQLFGLCSIIPEIPNTKVVFFVRNPFDWIQSWETKAWFSKKDILRFNILGLRRLCPEMINEINDDWPNYTRIQKLAWTWNYMNNLFYEAHQKHPEKSKIFTYEEVFVKHDTSRIKDFIGFISPEEKSEKYAQLFIELLENKVNQRKSEKESERKEWLSEDYKAVKNICGETMTKLGYNMVKYVKLISLM